MLVLLYIYIYINSTNIPPIVIINRICEHQNLLVYVLLGISPASDCGLPTFRNPLSVPSSKAGCGV